MIRDVDRRLIVLQQADQVHGPECPERLGLRRLAETVRLEARHMTAILDVAKPFRTDEIHQPIHVHPPARIEILSRQFRGLPFQIAAGPGEGDSRSGLRQRDVLAML